MKLIKLYTGVLFFFVSFYGNSQVMPNIPNTGAYNSSTEDLSPMEAPPHKGVVKQAGKFYIEIVVNWMLSSNNAVFYLLKDNGSPLTNDKVICTAQIERMDQEPEILDVKKWGTDAYSTQLKSDESYQLKVTFTKKNKTYSAIFQTSDKH